MSIAGSTSSQGTHSRSPSRSRSPPPYNDARYQGGSNSSSSRYSRYDSYSYRPSRNNMSAALDDYRELQDRDRDRELMDRDRHRPRSIIREDPYMSPRGRERHRDDRYPPYYRDEPPHYSSSSSNIMPRDYPKVSTSSLRREEKESKLPASSSSSSLKDIKDNETLKPSSTPTSADPYGPSSSSSSRYSMDWRDRERDRDRERERRYREDDRRHFDDRRRDGYRGFESSRYPPLGYPPFGGADSYRPDRDRDMPPSPNIPYYDRLDDRDFYRGRSSGGPNGGSNGGPSSSSTNPISDYDRYRNARGSGGRPWESRRMDRDHRPERIITDRETSNRSGRSSPISTSYPASAPPTAISRDRDLLSFSAKSTIVVEDKKEEQQNAEDLNYPSIEKSSTINSSPELTTTSNIMEDLETGEVVEEETKPLTTTTASPIVEDKVDISSTQTHATPMESIITTEVKNELDSCLPPTKAETTNDVQQIEQGEVIDEELAIKPITTTMTQEEIVGRISDIENQISQNEELLEAAIKREEEEEAARVALLEQQQQEQQTAVDEDVEMADDEDETAEDQAAQNKEEAKKQALQAMDNEPIASMDFTTNENATSSPVMRKRPQLLINQLRSKIDQEDDELYEKILSDNRKVAKENSVMMGGWQGVVEDMDDWSDEEKWKKPLYARIQDYPCYQDNIAKFEQLRISVTHALSTQKVAVEKKEKYLKNEFKRLYGSWKDKNLALDRMREAERRGPEKYSTHRMSSRRGMQQQQQQQQEPQSEEYTDGVIFTANNADALRFNTGGASTPYNNGLYTSDAARSEAELLEIIQSLESAEMRNPESRAKKTTATIPPMILDVRERMRTFDDRSGLVQDPLNYYHTGPNFGDTWNQEEVTTFMESYMMYPKQFERISMAIGTKTAPQCVLFYYRKKKKIDFKALMKKGRRGKTNKHRDRIAAAIRVATGDSSSNVGRKTKSKGSALMQDIGEAQNSRKAKEKDTERKNRELRDLEQANAYWDGVNERKRTKRPSNQVTVPPISTPIIQSGPPSSASDDTDMMLTANIVAPSQNVAAADKRRPGLTSISTNAAQQRRNTHKGRSPRESTTTTPTELVLPPGGTTKRYIEDMDTATATEEEDDKIAIASVAKWSQGEKEKAIDAFKEYGRDFVQVSGVVQTKTEEQCRNFYHNYKRKNGPNAFNEEDAKGDLSEIVTTPTAMSERMDLKAEEQDAAAALVGMFQMGANTTPREEKVLSGTLSAVRSRTPSSHDDIVLPNASIASTSNNVTPSMSNQQQKVRRRVRSASSRSESLVIEDTTTAEWADPDYGSKGRKLGRTSSLAATVPTEVKRPAYSSYWSVSEKNDFQHYLSLYGRDWEKLANAMKSKTVIQVRNFYANNEEKMALKDVVDRYQSSRQQTPQEARNDLVQPSPPLPPPSYDTSAAQHFQALQNFPFPSPIVDQQHPSTPPPLVSTSNASPNKSRIFSHSPKPPPALQLQQPRQPSAEVYNNVPTNRSNYTSVPSSSSVSLPPPQQQSRNRSLAALMDQPPMPSPPVTKVADLLNNDDPAEPNQKSWETWFGS